MKLRHSLLLKLGRKYEPSSVIGLRYKGMDLSIKTDEEGNAVVLFIGKVGPNGRIIGDRYTRILKIDHSGAVIKDHWDLKGKAT